ncbi:TetR/AcrR family transcriptional regulator [Streptomyces sp. NPDC045369]|uniref:TetR/AcrR family transcriptional regulator n=1 Tax=Streptomyces sp. NPDC045369 TaxID=3155732 RepID=UPI0033DE1034
MFEKIPASRASARPAVQRRGVERRRAILEAAEALLEEKGYEAATLKAIGERAGIPIASVYHYFSDRYQVEAELMQRHAHGLDARISAALDGSGPRTLREAADAVIDPLLGYFRRHPGCTELWFSGRSAPVVELVRAFDAAQAERLRHLLVERELLRADTPRIALQLAFEVGNRLFDIAFRNSAAGDDATIDEARRLITAYLATYAADGA